MSNTISTLDAIAKIQQLGDDESTNMKWITEAVTNFLSTRELNAIDDLPEEERLSLLELLKMGFVDNDLPLPDYLVEETDLSVGNVPEEVIIDEDKDLEEKVVDTDPAEVVTAADEVVDETHLPEDQKSESELLDELDKANKRLEVAKDFLKDLDTRLVKYESLDVDGLLSLLDKYESIGTPEAISEALDKFEKFEAELKKSEECSDKESTETEELKEESGDENSEELEVKDEADSDKSVNKESTKNEGEEMSEEKVVATSTELEDMKKLLDRYQALGTPEEIEELVKRSDSMIDDNADMAEKLESMMTNLENYESIGQPDEILEVIEEYASIKEKSESERIAKELNIPVEKVVSTINKMESVSEAEALLQDLFPKVESEEVEDAEEVAPKLEADETAEVVEVKFKTESDRMNKLRQLCAKL